jgi:dipeptidyl aminopeptidase/acylaminoacyl peptidase
MEHGAAEFFCGQPGRCVDNMMAGRSVFVYSVAAVLVAACPSPAQQKRAITPSDCVTVRDLQHDDSTQRSTIKISPDDSRIAYLVRSPNLRANENDIELYVRKLPEDPAHSGKPLLVGDISAVRWMADSKHVTMLIRDNGRRTIEQVDAETGHHEVLLKADNDIAEYSIDQSGDTVVYATDVPKGDPQSGPSPQEIASGYRISFQTSGGASWPSRRLFVTHRRGTAWTAAEPITIRSPLSQQRLMALTHAGLSYLQPTISPDGGTLLVSYWDLSETMPEEWRNSGAMKHRNTAGVIQAFALLVLYDLATKETTVPLRTPFVYSAPLWSLDSRSFVVAAAPPVGSELEQENVKSGRLGHSAGARLFWVEPRTGIVQQVAPKMAYPWGGPLYWDKGGDLFVSVESVDTITRFSRRSREWQAISSWQLPLRVGAQVATAGNYVIAASSDTNTPPQLFVYRPGEQRAQVFAKLNPQFDGLTLAHPEEVRWRTSTGFEASGLLLLPTNYAKGTKYPLVIHTKPFGSFFVCSFGDFPSFAPQPLANAGVMYLGQIGTTDSTQREEDYYPKGYPGYQGRGGVAEAAFAMDLWESAVKALDEQGLVDSSRVGIIGFSRTGWYTEYILAHSKVHYRAATVADNAQYSLGEYWLLHDAGTIKLQDLTYGGPPYGATLKNWLDHSVSFNLDKIHTPLLMEQMGYGIHYDKVEAPPLSLAVSFEVFSGLNRLNKPVELYYYPNEDHTPEHPQARLATMQRNVDWFRFWLKGEEDPDPAKAEQYKRWRELRKLQQQNEKNSPTRRPN